MGQGVLKWSVSVYLNKPHTQENCHKNALLLVDVHNSRHMEPSVSGRETYGKIGGAGKANRIYSQLLAKSSEVFLCVASG